MPKHELTIKGEARYICLHFFQKAITCINSREIKNNKNCFRNAVLTGWKLILNYMKVKMKYIIPVMYILSVVI